MPRLIAAFLLAAAPSALFALSGNAAVEKQYTIVCVGDSVTFGGHGGDVEGYYETEPTYPAWTDYYLGGDKSIFEVVNLGVSGACAQKSADKPYRDQPEYDELKKAKFDLAIVTLGTNDAKTRNWDEDRYRKEYIELLEDIQAMRKDATIAIGLPVPYRGNKGNNDGDWADDETILNKDMQRIIHEIADELDIPIKADWFNVMGGDNWDDKLYHDRIHPNEQGYSLMGQYAAENVVPAFVDGLKRPTPRPTSEGELCDNCLVVEKAGSGYELRTGDGRVLCEADEPECVAVDAGLRGPLPEDLSKMTHLTRLELSGNELRGEIPKKLKKLDNLEWLLLDRNELEGEIPDEWGSALAFVNLGENQLEGELPVSNFRGLGVYRNKLSGKLPDLGKDLELFGCGFNGFEGELPDSLWENTKLTELYLHDNDFTGGLSKDVGRLENLRILWMHENEFSGSLPEELGDLENLEVLDLSTNEFTDEIPKDLFKGMKDLAVLHLDNNDFKGGLPDVSRTALFELKAGNNKFKGGIADDFPDSLVVLELDSNQLEGDAPVCKNTNLVTLNLGHNLLTGGIPDGLPVTVENLYLHDNQLTGVLPTSLLALKTIKRLWLFKNQLSGAMNPQLYAGKELDLEWFDVHKNPDLGGELTEAFCAYKRCYASDTQISAPCSLGPGVTCCEQYIDPAKCGVSDDVGCPKKLEPLEVKKEKDDCPEDIDIPPCNSPGLEKGALCEGDGECGTSEELNNCKNAKGSNKIDIYVVVEPADDVNIPKPRPVPAPRPSGTVVACLGDSITAGGYPEVLGERLGSGWTVVNYGKAGRTVGSEKDYRDEPEYDDFLENGADAVIILLGTNDAQYDNWQGQEQFEDDYQTFIKKTLKDLDSEPQAIFLGYVPPLPPSDQDQWDTDLINGPLRDYVDEVRKWTAKKYEGVFVDVIDFWDALDGEDASPDDFLDEVHPNAAGNKQMAKKAQKALEAWADGGASDPRPSPRPVPRPRDESENEQSESEEESEASVGCYGEEDFAGEGGPGCPSEVGSGWRLEPICSTDCPKELDIKCARV